MKPLLLTLLLFIHVLTCFAQEDRKWETYFKEVCSMEDAESETWENAYEQLCELESNKIDLNKAIKEDLDKLFFLTSAQIEEISEYLYWHAPLRTMGELAMIESLEPERRHLLECFVYLGNDADKKRYPSLKNILKYGKQEVVFTGSIPMYDRKGDKSGYTGYKYKHWLKYSYKFGQYFQMGLVGSQDSGEPFFAGCNKWGYDYYSFYAIARNLGRVKSLVVGRYKARFGMGLVMNTNFSFGKIFALSSPNIGNSISPQTSRSESAYLQGGAATVNVLKGLDLTAILSFRKKDATLDDEGNVTTLVTSGYHRTTSEIQKKHNTDQMVVGGNLRYFNRGFHIGSTYIFSSFNRTFAPDTQSAFRKYNPAGKYFWNMGIDYGYLCHKFSFDGETATGDCGAIATIHRLTYQPIGELTFTAIQRFYSYKYYSLFSQSFSDGGKVQNESGLYVGATWVPSTTLTLNVYTDFSYFAWPRYQVSGGSHSWDNFLSLAYKKEKVGIQVRYRFRMRQYDDTDKHLFYRHEHRARTSVRYDINRVTLQTQGDVAYVDDKGSFGWMLTQNVGYSWSKLSLSALLGYFNTDDYYSRLYSYERGTLYSFSFPSFYGHGIHYSVYGRLDLCKNLMLICKLSTTDYFDRNKISSSYQQIDHSSKTDLDIQVRWKF